MNSNPSKKCHSDYDYKLLMIIALNPIVLGICRDGIPALFPLIQAEFLVSRAQVGLYSTFLFFSSTAVSIFSGWGVDRFGARKMMVMGNIGAGFIVFCYSFVPSFQVFISLVFFIGIFLSIIAPSSSKAVIESFPVSYRSTSMGIVHASIGIGSFLAAVFFPVLGGMFGWRRAVIVFGLLSIFLGLLIYKYYSPIQQGEGKKAGSKQDFRQLGKNLLVFIQNKNYVLICILGFIYGVGFSSANTHYTIFLQQDLQLSLTRAGFGFGLLHVGGILGRVGWGFVSDRLLNGSRKKGFLLISFSILMHCILFFLFFYIGIPPLIILYSLSFLFGFAVLGFFGLYATAVAEMAKNENMGLAIGLALIPTRFGHLFSPPIFGYISDLRGLYDLSWLLLGLIIIVATLFTYRLLDA